MKPIFDAYGGPYKDRCRFWTGFLLLVHVILAQTVSLDNDDNVSLDVLTSLLIVIALCIFYWRDYIDIFLCCVWKHFHSQPYVNGSCKPTNL